MAGPVRSPEATGRPPRRVSDVRELPLIAIESSVGCDLAAARRIFEAPVELLRLWPGVEEVRTVRDGFAVTQQLEFPFWGVLRQEFVVRIHERPRDRRQRYAIWKTEGWLFDRAIFWKLRSTKQGVALDFGSQHALSGARLEEAVNVYRSRTIWPMRHDADEILERLVISFLHDRLVELDRAYVERVREWLGARSDSAAIRRGASGPV